MPIKFLRVLGVRSKDPSVIATVDGFLVKWTNRRDWDCECLSVADRFECEHIETIRNLIDDRVVTPITPEPIRRSGSLK